VTSQVGAQADLVTILRCGTRAAMTPAQIEVAVARQVASSQCLAGEDLTPADILRILRGPR
jgi:hypothetical protein